MLNDLQVQLRWRKYWKNGKPVELETIGHKVETLWSLPTEWRTCGDL